MSENHFTKKRIIYQSSGVVRNANMMDFLLICLAVQALFIAYQVIELRNLKKANRKARGKILSVVQKNQKLIHALYLKLEGLTQSHSLPTALLGISFADETGIILDVKRVSFSSPTPAYNASIGFAEGNYHLFFRYDLPLDAEHSSFISNIGSIQLDNDLNPLEQTFYKVHTHSAFSEDPRFFQHEARNFLVYSDLAGDQNCRSIHLAAINLKDKQLDSITALYRTFGKTEKNWTPFSHQGDIHFVYDIEQHQIISLPDPKQNNLFSFPKASCNTPVWSNQWGILRGGTPAIFLNGEYLSFFHSSFEDDKGILWYVMGAYTFAAFSPFKLTRISPHPLLFKGIYDTPHRSCANPKIRSLYPSGLILRHYDGKESIVVSCGENDSGIKLITLDKTALLASMKSL